MKIIFIIGNSRSGTTMLSNVLGNNDNVLVFKELHYFDIISTADLVFYNFNIAIIKYAKLLCANKLEPWNLHKYKSFLSQAKNELNYKEKVSNYEVFKQFVNNQLKLHRKTIAVEQTPKNSFFFEKIFRNIPESQFIHIIRDPRDILLSQKHKWKRNRLGGNMSTKEIYRTYFNYNPFITSFIYRKTINRINQNFNRISKNNIFEIKFESILNYPKIEIKKLYDFLNLKYSDKVVDIKNSSSSFVSNTEKGIDPNRIYRWEKSISNTELFINQIINKKLINRYSYFYKKVIPNPIILLFYFIMIPIQGIIILYLNRQKFIHNFKNIFSFLYK